MNALEKAKSLKELKTLNDNKAGLSGLVKAKALKRIIELRLNLGMGINSAPTVAVVDPIIEPVVELVVEPTSNQIYQTVIDGAEINQELIKRVLEQAQNEKDPSSNAQLIQAVELIRKKVIELSGV
jgi:hypothetical protein